MAARLRLAKPHYSRYFSSRIFMISTIEFCLVINFKFLEIYFVKNGMVENL